jgi:hypothetical protein
MEIYIEPYDIGCRPTSTAGELLLLDQDRQYILFGATSKHLDTKTRTFKDLGTAVLCCQNCFATKYGYPNDHGLPEHPLYKHGIEEILDDHSRYSAVLEVFNSPWSSDIMEQINTSIKRIDDPLGFWKEITPDKVRHFIILFREQTFECIASSMVVERYCETYAETLSFIKEIQPSLFRAD